jgi:hypothetical protein
MIHGKNLTKSDRGEIGFNEIPTPAFTCLALWPN